MTNIIIRNSLFVNNRFTGSGAMNDQYYKSVIRMQPAYSDNNGDRRNGRALIINNTFYDNQGHNVLGLGADMNDLVQYHIYNNIFSEYQSIAIGIDGSNINLHSDHNLFDKNDGNYQGLNNPDLSVSGLDNDIVAGPKFKNSSSGDFRLSNASQAVDAGLFSYDDSYDEVCPYEGGGATDVVYSFTPATDMAVNMSTCYSSYDTKLYVYADANGTLAPTTTGDPACSDDTTHPINTDCTAWTSYIEGVSMTAGTTYYIVVDGWGSSAGDYEVEFTPYNPLAGYTILTADGPVGTAARNATEWSTVLFAAEPTDLALSVRADYAIPGIFDIVSSDVVGPVTAVSYTHLTLPTKRIV